ncbi:MAG: putative metal-binding motif-containing protein [Myxococcales bacterium]|nr:putative metal-binding motif-containing protein [Myxococcales bacterium]
MPAIEVCDGVDNDGDGRVDEGFDRDLDGFAACAECDDRNPDRHPGVPDLCNRSDDDCDGRVDEDCL